MAIKIESTIAFPLISEPSPRRSGYSQPAVAANVLAVPLNAVEVMLCEKLRVAPEDYVAARAVRRRGQNPLSKYWLGGRVDSSSPTTIKGGGGGFRQV
jgi:hypothetical protein